MRHLILVLAVLSILPAQPAEELNFTKSIGELRDLPQQFPDWLRAEAGKYLANRPLLDNAAAVKARGKAFREQILANIGGLPERTPLNARTVGVIEREHFRIEKVIFESQPKFYVTANLYLPKQGTGPYPAILFPLGHESGAKAHEAWQYVLGSFATKGFVALAWDTAGQGERVQFFDPDLRGSRIPGSTREHTMLGIQALVVGDSLARYTIWDGIRALDYLASRKEVDPERIGVTGNSGGGTHTAYLAAIDDRLKVAAPSCYITNWTRLLAQLGPQDAEQNLPPFLNLGYDFPDFLYAFAPKPYLVLSAIRDFFPIGGARATFAEAQRVYDSLGAAEKVKMVEADDGHGYTLPRRVAAYAWFSKWLKGQEDDGVEPQFPLATEAELQCTDTGQVSTSLGGETVFTLNQQRAQQVRVKSDAVEDARRLSGYQPIPGAPPVTGYGTIRKKGYRIEKLTYQSEPGISIPAILAIPDGAAGKRSAIIYAAGTGKASVASKLESWMAQGSIVLAIDIRGLGELAKERTMSDAWFGDTSNIFAALLIGRSMPGMRALDIVRAVELLSARPDVDPAKITGIGIGRASVGMLYAAVFDDRLRSLELDGLLTSYQSIVDARLHRNAFEHVVQGAIRHYDIDDLLKVISRRPVKVRNRVGPLGEMSASQ
ncbi:MAG: acetylxylan esterase [Acidobacteria bacterium]|nr:acetylxylan esterase [Acidobacteriota bacterium]